jgi:hypothetical protein
MPKASSKNPAPSRLTPAATAVVPSQVDIARATADAMFRAAEECCHQHDRVSLVMSTSTIEDEVVAVQRICAMCNETLRNMVTAYERDAGSVKPQRSDDHWWRAANGLWLASREYARRAHCGDAASKEFKTHDRDRLGALHAEYELEASSVLALRQAADAYRKTRPSAA